MHYSYPEKCVYSDFTIRLVHFLNLIIIIRVSRKVKRNKQQTKTWWWEAEGGNSGRVRKSFWIFLMMLKISKH